MCFFFFPLLFLLRRVSALFVLGFCIPECVCTHFKVFITGCASGELSRAAVGLRSRIHGGVKAPRFVRRWGFFLRSSNNGNRGRQTGRAPFRFIDTSDSWEYTLRSKSNFGICLKRSVQICLSCDPSNHQNPSPWIGLGWWLVSSVERRFKAHPTSGWHSSSQSRGCSRRSVNATLLTSSSGV